MVRVNPRTLVRAYMCYFLVSCDFRDDSALRFCLSNTTLGTSNNTGLHCDGPQITANFVDAQILTRSLVCWRATGSVHLGYHLAYMISVH